MALAIVPVMAIKRAPLSKLCYSIMSSKQLKDHLKRHGLRTSGDRAALISRHREYTLRHNSECDSLNPKSIDEIIQDLYAHEDLIKASKQQQQKQQLSPPFQSQLPTPSSLQQQPLSAPVISATQQAAKHSGAYIFQTGARASVVDLTIHSISSLLDQPPHHQYT
eukprot:gene1530-1786_t